MKKKGIKSVIDILRTFEELNSLQTFIGIKTVDQNIIGNFLLIENSETIYSFNSLDIVNEEKLQNGKVKVTMRLGCVGLISKPYKITQDKVTILSTTENNIPPKPIYKKGDPKIATKKDVEKIKKLQPLARTLPAVAVNWSNSCSLGDLERNNCAHFLSDAFIKAGYTELKKSGANSNIKEWCDWNDSDKDSNSRPVRAKEMWEWFKTMST